MRTRAALFHAVGEPLEVREVEVEEPGPEHVLVRMAAVGICGSDLHVVKGEWTRPTPMALGHEGAGVVEAVGSAVRHVAPGDRVVLSWAPSCGVCAPCRDGVRTACVQLRAAMTGGTMLDGETRLSADGAPVYRMTTIGALADLVLVPASAALPLTHDVPLEQAALLGCAALTGVGAVLNSARVEAGASVLVIGAGGVGQFAVQGARIAGAARIDVVDPVEARREAALALGATGGFAPEDVDAVDEYDFAFDAVGLAATSELALRAARRGGLAVLVGMPPAGTRLDVDPLEFSNREKRLTGSVYGSAEPAEALPRLLDLVRDGRLELAPLVGPSFPLERVNEAIDASLAGSAGRVLVAAQVTRVTWAASAAAPTLAGWRARRRRRVYATLDLELSWSERDLPQAERTKHVHKLHPVPRQVHPAARRRVPRPLLRAGHVRLRPVRRLGHDARRGERVRRRLGRLRHLGVQLPARRASRSRPTRSGSLELGAARRARGGAAGRARRRRTRRARGCAAGTRRARSASSCATARSRSERLRRPRARRRRG